MNGVLLEQALGVEDANGNVIDAGWFGFPGPWAPEEKAALSAAGLYEEIGWSQDCVDDLIRVPCRNLIAAIPLPNTASAAGLCEVASGSVYEVLNNHLTGERMSSITQGTFDNSGVTIGRPSTPSRNSPVFNDYHNWTFTSDGRPDAWSRGMVPCPGGSDSECVATSLRTTGNPNNYNCQQISSPQDVTVTENFCVQNACVVHKAKLVVGTLECVRNDQCAWGERCNAVNECVPR